MISIRLSHIVQSFENVLFKIIFFKVMTASNRIGAELNICIFCFYKSKFSLQL